MRRLARAARRFALAGRGCSRPFCNEYDSCQVARCPPLFFLRGWERWAASGAASSLVSMQTSVSRSASRTDGVIPCHYPLYPIHLFALLHQPILVYMIYCHTQPSSIILLFASGTRSSHRIVPVPHCREGIVANGTRPIKALVILKAIFFPEFFMLKTIRHHD